MAISAQYGASPDYFGHADYAQARGSGYNPLQILQYLQANQSQLRDKNVPGGGGLYDEVRADADRYQKAMQPPPPPPPAPKVEIPPPPPTVPAPMAIRGNASGVRRKKSKADQLGTNTSGTSQFNRSMFINPVPINNLNV